MTSSVFVLVFLGVGLAALFLVVRYVQRLRARNAMTREESSGTGVHGVDFAKGEALFKSMFPDLQPYFHPARLAQWLAAYRERKGRMVGDLPRMDRPVPGFPEAQRCELLPDDNRKYVRVLDAEGLPCCEFHLEEERFGAMLATTAGSFRVDLDNPDDPAISFRASDREFDWSRKGGWRFRTPVAEQGIDSYDDGLRWSDDAHSSSSSSPASGMIVAAGGAFGGAGASGAWDEAHGESTSAQGDTSPGGTGETPAY